MRVSRMIQGIFKGVESCKGGSSRIKGCSKCFKRISRLLKEVQKVCQGSFNGVKRVFK